MNHYERLKVSQDAPAEVIRAAYRALAAKLHPDRQGLGNGAAIGPDDETHTQMAALNAAYEVLIDPKLRREYDATLLAPSRSGGASAFGATFTGFGAAAAQAASSAKAGIGLGIGVGAPDSDANEPAGPSTRVDLNWVPPGVATTAKPIWPPSRRMMLIGGSALALVIVGGAGVTWQVMGQHKMERAMSDQYSTPPDMPVPGRPAREGDGARGMAQQEGGEELVTPSSNTSQRAALAEGSGKHRPSVEELANMSDEELLKVLPTLDDDHPIPQKELKRIARHHPLDGKPLNLRTESHLIDPLAAEQAAQASQQGNRRP